MCKPHGNHKTKTKQKSNQTHNQRNKQTKKVEAQKIKKKEGMQEEIKSRGKHQRNNKIARKEGAKWQ